MIKDTMEKKNKMKDKQRKYYNLNPKDLFLSKTGDIVRVVLDAKNQRWTKAIVGRDLNVETETDRKSVV